MFQILHHQIILRKYGLISNKRLYYSNHDTHGSRLHKERPRIDVEKRTASSNGLGHNLWPVSSVLQTKIIEFRAIGSNMVYVTGALIYVQCI